VRPFSPYFLALVCGSIALAIGSASSEVVAGPAPDYLRDVKPLLTRKCYSCHGALKQSGGLRLDTRGTMLAGGESGAAVVPRDVTKSLLLSAVRGNGDIERMPLESEPLSSAEIALLDRWIAAGAPGPDEPLPPDPRKYWSFQPVVRPKLPGPQSPGSSQHPIDALLAVEHQRRGLMPGAEADPRTLVRRLYLDLIGLPPTPADVGHFVRDYSGPSAQREQAYRQVVDKLLSSPQYAERWGRHWMDVWRYSDWDGYRAEVRESQPHVWRWREWIIDALTADKPYDQMILEMLAGDEIAPTDPDTLRATGFLVRNWYKFNRNVWLEATVEHTGKAFLGLTVNCAKCHDHFFDPISQRDYYALRAFFEPHQVRTDRLPGQADTAIDGLVRVYDADAQTPTYLFARGDESKPDKSQALNAHIPRLFASMEPKITAIDLPIAAAYSGFRSFVRAEELARAKGDVEAARKALERAKPDEMSAAARKLALAATALEAIAARLAADEIRYAAGPASSNSVRVAELAKIAADAERKLATLHAADSLARTEAQVATAKNQLQAAGSESAALAKAKKAVADAEKKLADAKQAVAAAAANAKKTDVSYSPFSAVYPRQSTGRRLALARWIASRDNPLTARVAVNQIWMRHFGEPIVSSVFDFGHNGRLPSNQALLDWLASELVDGGWRMKSLHRTIVTSAAYRRTSSEANERNRQLDADNAFLWRMNARRMEAEVVRDSILFVAGSLDLARGGADLDPATADRVPRRSLYFRHSKEKKVELLDQFDRANAVECYRRSESIVPQQALAIANSALAQTQARVLAKSLASAIQPGRSASGKASIDEERFIVAAFERILNHPPSSQERDLCLEFLTQQTAMLAEPSKLTRFVSGAKLQTPPAATPRQRACENLVLVLLNHNDFLTIR
jgi:hypothetical protein